MGISADRFMAKLEQAYSIGFDKKEVPQPQASASGLAAVYAFHSSNECYVLSPKVRLWSTETHEYAYVFAIPSLTAEAYAQARDLALSLGRGCIRPHIDHMTSNITAIIVCDEMDAAAADALERTRVHKDFMLSLFGWMDFRAAAVIPANGTIVSNRAGRELVDFLRSNLEKCCSKQEGKN